VQRVPFGGSAGHDAAAGSCHEGHHGNHIDDHDHDSTGSAVALRLEERSAGLVRRRSASGVPGQLLDEVWVLERLERGATVERRLTLDA
jgi:hypothetical protein